MPTTTFLILKLDIICTYDTGTFYYSLNLYPNQIPTALPIAEKIIPENEKTSAPQSSGI